MKVFANMTTALAASAGLLSTAKACLTVTAKYDAATDKVTDFRMIDNGAFLCHGAFLPGFNNAAGVLPLSCSGDANWAANLVKIGATGEEEFRVEVLDRAGPRRFKFPLVFKCVDNDVKAGQKCKVADLTASEYGC